MKQLTQEEFNKLERNKNGYIVIPAYTDCTQIQEFPEWCRFGECCSFGKRCTLEENKELITSYLISIGGFGSENRTTYFLPVKEGLYVRCGCFGGWLEEFKGRIKETHQDSHYAKEYLLMCDLAQMRYKNLKDKKTMELHILVVALAFCVALQCLKDWYKEHKEKLEREKQRRIYLAKDCAMHLNAYQEKMLTDYYGTVNQNVVSLPPFIEAKKAMEDQGYVS